MRILLIFLALAACGAGGEPETSGEITVSNHGVGGKIETTNGNFTIGVGF